MTRSPRIDNEIDPAIHEPFVAVILGPLDEGLEVLRRDQANAMAQSA
jgi:hypothetical protein